MRTNRELARLVIADLAQYSGLTFTYPDRLTKAEAEAVIAWAQKQPEVARAYRDRSHREHESVALFKGVVDHFAYEHPTLPHGEPATWPDRAPAPVKPGDDSPFAGLHSDEAEARLAWARTRPEYQAYYDRYHPQHNDYVEQTRMLMEIAHGTPATDQASSAPAAASPESAVALERIKQLQGDEAYLNGGHPEHQAKVAEMAAAYATAYPEASGPGVGAPQQPAASQPVAPISNPSERIKELQANPAYRDRSHPEHQAIVESMRQAYEAAHPEPPAAA